MPSGGLPPSYPEAKLISELESRAKRIAELEESVERAVSLAEERAKQAAVFEEEVRKGRSLAGARAKQIAELESAASSSLAAAAERGKQVCAWCWCDGGDVAFVCPFVCRTAAAAGEREMRNVMLSLWYALQGHCATRHRST